MKHALRTLLTSLLLVAVPVQGYAAGAMLFCGAALGRDQAAAVDQSGHMHAGHAHEADTHHHDAATATDDHRSAPDLADLLHGVCSVCASCCNGVALPAASMTTEFSQPRASPLLAAGDAAPERAPARLERPPRTALA